MPEILVKELFEEQKGPLQLQLVAGARGLNNRINHTRLQKYGLAFTGYYEHFHPNRVQVLGKTELGYLATLSPDRAQGMIEAFTRHPICCIVITKNQPIPDAFVTAVERSAIPLLRSACESSFVISQLSAYLESRLSPTTTAHGVLIDVNGVGVLILGKSGIGKSESALHLIQQGHRLVADDVVNIRRAGDQLVGQAMAMGRHYMEIRGLGILNIRDLFGVVSIRNEKIVELVIELEEWDPDEEYDRLGLDEMQHEILGVSLPYVRLAVKPGRNIPTLVEIAARNQLLKWGGHRSAETFNEEMLRHLSAPWDHHSRPTDVDKGIPE